MVVAATIAVVLLFALVSRNRSRLYRVAGGVALAQGISCSPSWFFPCCPTTGTLTCSIR